MSKSGTVPLTKGLKYRSRDFTPTNAKKGLVTLLLLYSYLQFTGGCKGCVIRELCLINYSNTVTLFLTLLHFSILLFLFWTKYKGHFRVGSLFYQDIESRM